MITFSIYHSILDNGNISYSVDLQTYSWIGMHSHSLFTLWLLCLLRCPCPRCHSVATHSSRCFWESFYCPTCTVWFVLSCTWTLWVGFSMSSSLSPPLSGSASYPESPMMKRVWGTYGWVDFIVFWPDWFLSCCSFRWEVLLPSRDFYTELSLPFLTIFLILIKLINNICSSDRKRILITVLKEGLPIEMHSNINLSWFS